MWTGTVAMTDPRIPRLVIFHGTAVSLAFDQDG